METISKDELFLSELFDALPESVILFKPLIGDNEEVLDFEVAYCNNATSAFLRSAKPLIVGQTTLTTRLLSDEYKRLVFKQCREVWITGKTSEDRIDSKHTGRHFSALRSKMKGGVLSVTRDRTEFFNVEKQRDEQADRFTKILDASADGVMVLEAIRNSKGEAIDFKFTHCNKAAFDLAKISPAAIGKSLLDILPHLGNSEQFDLHRQVLETGLPKRIETTFRDEEGKEYGWFIVSLMKMGESVISTFIDISEKKENELKIEEQADLLNSIFEASINGIFACEAIRNEDDEIVDFRILKINHAFTQIIGLSAEDAEGKSYHSLFPSAKRLGTFHLYTNVIRTGENLRKELFYDGDKIKGWFDISAVKRGCNGIVITFTNITDSKSNKQSIEDGARYLQDVIDSSQTGILLLSAVRNSEGNIVDFRFKTVNHTAAAIIGKQPAELIGRLHNEIFTESVNNGLFQHYKEFADGTAIKHRFENFYVGDGLNAWFDVMVKKRNEDLLITLHDFTPLKKLQVELSTVARKLNSVLNTATAGMFTLQPVFSTDGEIEDFRFTIVNQAVADYIGEKADKLTGALASRYFAAHKSNGLFDVYKDTYLNNSSHNFDYKYEEEYDMYFKIHTVKAGDEVLVTFTDHTALKKLQVQLEASIEELKKSNASLEEFAYAASHDLQEPLRKINYFAERLRKAIGPKLSEDEGRMFERIENAAGRMSILINDLLTYSQVSRSTRAFNTTDLTEIVQQVLNDLETTIAEKKAIITTGELVKIQGDHLQLRQLFQNLLSNSLKYSKNDVPPVISINCALVQEQINGVPENYYRIQITDNGIGFEPEHSEKIFKVFQRLHGQSEFPGTGIGLAIVQKVIENHHGFITAEGRPDEGAIFTILLPKDE